MKILISIGGPTASGKTELAVKLAEKYSTEIISFDSRQIFKELNIGVAKPEAHHLERIRHHFISTVSIHENYSAGKYEEESSELLKQLFLSHDKIITVGGTGLYCDALLYGLDEIPVVSEESKDFIQTNYRSNGLRWLQEYVLSNDLDYYNHIDIQNDRRLLRAAMVIHSTQKPFSTFRTKTAKPRSYEMLNIALLPDREWLYERINSRVDEMIKLGLEEEVSKLKKYSQLNALKTIGYTEFFEYFDGNLTYDETVSLIKQKSRNYAKRQMTWFRNHKDWRILSGTLEQDYLTEIENWIYDLES